MYEGLLLSTGGGIISDREKSEQQGEPTIIIGLGGTGVDALKVVKKKVYEQLYPDNPDGEIPAYKRIGFLAIDTDDICDDKGSTDVYSLRENECLSIRVNDLTAKMEKDIAEGKIEFDWLQSDLKLLSAKGAGTVRQVGRYCLFKNIDKIKSEIDKLKEIVTRDSDEHNVNVHIIAGISGGTGSGTFIDMCYIIRDLLGTDATLFGYFFMPDVNLFKTGVNDKAKTRIRGNGYAALKELDYTMNLGSEGKTFSQYYGGRDMYSVRESSKPLVDLCHLISATESNGNTITNGYTYSMNIVGEYILSYLAKVEDNVADGAKTEALTLAAHLANVNNLMGAIKKKHGENLNYHILGASTAELPTREIGTYLAAELYKKLEKGLVEKEPNDAEVEQHANAMKLIFEKFKAKLLTGITDAYSGIDWYSNDFSIDDILNTKIISNGTVVEDTYDSIGMSMRRIILGPARDWESNSKGKLKGNFDKLTKDLDDFTIIEDSENTTTLISTVFQYLQNKIVANLSYGAVYASRLTHNDHGYSLNNRLSEIIEEADIKKGQCEEDRKERVGDIIRAVKDCKDSTKGIALFGLLKKRQEECIEAYKDAIRAYFQNEFDIKVYTKIMEMAGKLQKQIDADGYPNSLYHKYFTPLENMLQELKKTFQKNSEYLNAPDDRNESFVWKIVNFNETKDRIDSKFKEKVGDDVSEEYKSFVKMLMNKYREWVDKDTAKIEQMISVYMQEMFEDLLNWAMEDYLNDKYNTRDEPDKLKEKVKTELLENGVLRKAEPKFYLNTAHEISPAIRHVLNVPKTEHNVCAAAQEIAKNASDVSPLDFRCTGLGNKIFAVKFESGIPLYAYGLIDDLEREYMSGGTDAIGRHLYEITERNESKNWTNLQSFIPYSIDIEHKACKDGEELERLYHEAEKRGVIAENKHSVAKYDVYKLNKPAIKKRDDFMKEGRVDISELNMYVEKLKSYTDGNGKLKADDGKNKNIKEVKPLLNDGRIANGKDYREVCRIDYFIRFRGLQEVVKESLKILDDVDAAIKEATEWQNEGEEREKTIRLITEALCLDFFEAGIGKYTYNGVLLWSGTMKYGKFPVYQIYQTFSSDAFTDNERKELENDVNDKIEDLKSTDKEKVEKIKNKYIDNINTGINNAIKQASVLSEFGDIETVYKLFEREVQALLNLFEM